MDKTLEEILEYFEPNGNGTPEQRIARLVAHSIITFARGCEILGISSPEGLPKINSTGCNCLGCRRLINNECEFFYG